MIERTVMVMGLFDKKYCDFCGEKIGLLGNKKLEDGNMCKDCASKLSPWFNERRHSTKVEIQEQLEYREANKARVAAFHTTRSLGKYTKLLLDENQQQFMVTSASNLAFANPDVLDYSQVTGCDLEVDESRHELRQTNDEGKQVSYDPPRYEYSYDFHVSILVNHPFFDKIRYSLSNGYVKTGERPDAVVPGSWQLNVSTTGNPRLNDYYNYLSLGSEIKACVDSMRYGGQPMPVPEPVPSPEPIPAPDSELPGVDPSAAVVCPWCGSLTVPDEKGCCQFCCGTVNS